MFDTKVSSCPKSRERLYDKRGLGMNVDGLIVVYLGQQFAFSPMRAALLNWVLRQISGV